MRDRVNKTKLRNVNNLQNKISFISPNKPNLRLFENIANLTYNKCCKLRVKKVVRLKDNKNKHCF